MQRRPLHAMGQVNANVCREVWMMTMQRAEQGGHGDLERDDGAKGAVVGRLHGEAPAEGGLTNVAPDLSPADRAHEDAIDRAFLTMCGACSPDMRRKAHDRMIDLVRKRSPEAVAALEQANGLVRS